MAQKNNYPALYAYPAVLTRTEDGWQVRFPDFANESEGCAAEAATLTEVLLEARYALEDTLYQREQNNLDVLMPTSFTNIKANPSELVQLVVAEMPPVRRAYSQKAVKKTLTIPAWMEDELKKHPELNVSRLLQDAIKRELNLEEPD